MKAYITQGSLTWMAVGVSFELGNIMYKLQEDMRSLLV